MRLTAESERVRAVLAEDRVARWPPAIGPASIVECHDLVPGRQGLSAGHYDMALRIDGDEVARESMEIADTIEGAGYNRSDRVFVQGRTNYDAARTAPGEYTGHFVWVFTFGADGRVDAVETREAGGIATGPGRAGFEQAAWLYRIGLAEDPSAPPRRLRLRYDFEASR